MSLEMAHKVILPPKKNYIPQFLKQRDINSYFPPSLPSRLASLLVKNSDKSKASTRNKCASAVSSLYKSSFLCDLFSFIVRAFGG
jgi:hypothetical protein